MSWSHRTDFPGVPRSVAVARKFVRIHLVEHGLPTLVDDLLVVVSELATNAVIHARTAFSVTLEGDHSSVLLSVQDGSAAAAARDPARAAGERGRGLAMVEQLSQRWGTTRQPAGGKSVWAWFDEAAPILNG